MFIMLKQLIILIVLFFIAMYLTIKHTVIRLVNVLLIISQLFKLSQYFNYFIIIQIIHIVIFVI